LASIDIEENSHLADRAPYATEPLNSVVLCQLLQTAYIPPHEVSSRIKQYKTKRRQQTNNRQTDPNKFDKGNEPP
jgi:hypothetical protein